MYYIILIKHSVKLKTEKKYFLFTYICFSIYLELNNKLPLYKYIFKSYII